MKKHCKPLKTWLYIALLLFFSWRTIAAQDETPEMREYVLGLIYRGENWKPNVPDIQAAHQANINRLVGLGDLLIAGPAVGGGDFRGIFLYNTSRLEEARTMVDSDPAVQAGQLRVELFSWWGPARLEDLGMPVKE